MKKYLVYMMCAAAAVIGGTSCSDFGDTNTDPENLNDGNIDYAYLFTNAQHQALGSDWDVWRNGCIYGTTMLQQTSSFNWSQGTFYVWDGGYNSAYWDAIYSGDRAAARDIALAMRNWEGDSRYSTDYQMARIVKAYVYLRLTDLYGDIPYSQAIQPEEYPYPAYDTQQSIYMDLLKELNEAQAALDGAQASYIGGADVYFNGDLTKWRKFANSLILRMAMRMSKVDEASARQWVKTAVDNGIIMSNEDNAMLQHPNGSVADDSSEPYGKIFSDTDAGAFFLAEYFVNLLKSTNDPRLALIATVCSADPRTKYSAEGYDYGNNDPAIQMGMPSGYDNEDGPFDISQDPNYPGDDKYRTTYSTVNRNTYSDPTAPTFIVTYAENCFLLAEAAYRGWLDGTSASGTAQSYYEEGVRAAMKQFSQFPNATSLYNTYLTDAAIDQYLAENPFDQSRALEQINTQYYINTFCDAYETFANWRRSGYPVLTPVNKDYPNNATNGTIPRRFTYPTTESTVNTTNYQEAVARLNNGDSMTSRVWWDVE